MKSSLPGGLPNDYAATLHPIRSVVQWSQPRSSLPGGEESGQTKRVTPFRTLCHPARRSSFSPYRTPDTVSVTLSGVKVVEAFIWSSLSLLNSQAFIETGVPDLKKRNATRFRCRPAGSGQSSVEMSGDGSQSGQTHVAVFSPYLRNARDPPKCEGCARRIFESGSCFASIGSGGRLPLAHPLCRATSELTTPDSGTKYGQSFRGIIGTHAILLLLTYRPERRSVRDASAKNRSASPHADKMTQ